MNIDQQFKIHDLTRHKFLAYLQQMSPEQLADIPYGFRNNIWWNIVHAMATQQLLCYYLSDNPMLIEMNWIEGYKKGTAPELNSIPTEQEIKEISELLLSTSEQLELDYAEGLFTVHKNYPTSYGFTMESIEDAIIFTNVHEAMHLGTIIAMSKLV